MYPWRPLFSESRLSTSMIRACLVGLGSLSGVSWNAAAGAVTTWRVTEITLRLYGLHETKYALVG